MMKWYSVKKYAPPTHSWLICRVLHVDGWSEYITALVRSINDGEMDWECGVWSSETKGKEDEFEITHFCIPDAVSLED